MNHSPWLAQLKRARPELVLESDLETDIIVLGGGIAGIATAYYLLRDTKKRVVLIEANKIAHGATGHNAGQVVSYFERPFQSIVQEFGLTQAAQAQKSIDDAWLLLEGIIHDTDIKAPLTRVTGYVGISNYETLLSFCEDIRLKRKAGITSEDLFIADEPAIRDRLPLAYRSCVTVIAKTDIQELIETTEDHYIAVGASQKGCLNSALFCEELIGYLLANHPDRFRVVEQTPIQEVFAGHATIIAKGKNHQVIAKEIVLCTNGFEHFTIKNEGGSDIDPRFHMTVNGVIGYMTGYLTGMGERPTAVSYLPKTYAPESDYFYVTRRPYEKATGERHNLVCIGGPVDDLPEKLEYQPQAIFPQAKQQEIQNFASKLKQGSELHSPAFTWHGLMGYTPNRIRLIGHEPCNPRILYNLGCNGIGILPSIYGGKRIAELCSGREVTPSIFDPRDRRCERPLH